ncbi:MAG TPA: acyl-homoserine-lactone synthase, partial [Rhodospirillales bacterium]|nr:acyl-homoserine-lactone synthase [Rhodospirillales bacterium]
MIDAFTVETAHLLGDALPALHRLRHKIFVERHGYQVPTYRGMEWDTFDTPAAVYLLWRDDLQQVRAIARLIPTTFPYMIKELWPELIYGRELPSRPDVWEVTRLGVDRALAPALRRRVFGEMMCACGEFGRRMGISEYYLVTHPWVIRSIEANGCRVRMLGHTRAIGRCVVKAAAVQVSDAAIATLRRTYSLPPKVLRVAG